MTRFCALYSGSSGNCTYIESGGSAVLIDAGVSLRAIKVALQNIGADVPDIGAVFVTHEHIDHIRGLPMLLRKFGVPVYASRGTLDGIRSEFPTIEGELNELQTGCCAELGGLCVSSFGTCHDSRESVGYHIQTKDGFGIAVATDLGVVTEEVLHGISDCELVMLESNHDVGMLRRGRYPYYLKKRILSERGHLSNDDCSAVLPALAAGGAHHFVLAHLSSENNLPQLAEQVSEKALDARGMRRGSDYTLEAAPRSGPGNVYEL